MELPEQLEPLGGEAAFLPSEEGKYEITRSDLDTGVSLIHSAQHGPTFGIVVSCPCWRLGRLRDLETLVEARKPLQLTDIGFVCSKGINCPLGHRYEVTVIGPID